MNHIGLFEGIGGFSLAAKWMGWQTVAWCEWNEFCQKVLKQHFKNATGHGDIDLTDFKIYANRIDVLTGGFPCQPYSVAGLRKGKMDERHKWPQMLRAIREIKAPWIVGENVYGLLNWSNGLVFDEVQNDLENEGYEVQTIILPACSKNAPHIRKRIWFIAYSHSNDARRRGYGETGFKESESKEKKQEWKRIRDEFKRNGEKEIITNSIKFRLSEQGKFERCLRDSQEETWQASWVKPNDLWPSQSPILGRYDGVSNRMDRTKALGNAIVPQVAYEIFKAIEKYKISTK